MNDALRGGAERMPAGRELDALVAERVFGGPPVSAAPYAFLRTATGSHPGYGPCDGFGPKGECSVCTGLLEHDVPAYSTSMAAAWEVVEAMRARGPRFWWGIETAGWNVPDAQRARLFEGSVAIADGEAETAPLAICRAALAALPDAAAPPEQEGTNDGR